MLCKGKNPSLTDAPNSEAIYTYVCNIPVDKLVRFDHGI